VAPDSASSPSAGAPGDIRAQHHPTARSLTILLARNPDKVPGCEPVAELGAMIDPGELRLDISERELLTEPRRFTNATRPAICAAA
jgi:hypothetical protein